MRAITELTSKICGCTTWSEWETTDPQETRVVTDFAICPCQIHDPVNHGKILLDENYANREYLINIRDTQLTLTGESVLMTFMPGKTIEKFTEVRPTEITNKKDSSRVVPLSKSTDFRKEIILKANTEGVLLNVPEISEDDLVLDLETGEIENRGRKFKQGIEFEATFNNQRRMSVNLKGANASQKNIARLAVQNAPIDVDIP